MLALSFVTLLGFASTLVQALTLVVPSTLNDSNFNTITFTSTPDDPPNFTVVIVNKKLNVEVTMLDSVPKTDTSITFNLPGLPEGKNYTLVAYAVGDTSKTLFESAPFEVVESRVPTSESSSTGTQSATSGSQASASNPNAPTAATTTKNNNVPAAPSNAPTFPGTTSSDDSAGGGAFHVGGPIAAVAVLATLAVGFVL
ncbi:hypothetical protein BKA62DRAFT_694502 [Auriculariales sp. MPI-PUGE-AT-0066]|nr:hypothetical protein BKA62DRAFT_694502 [Auriculariales sp. MPI-PUGE-AT-0066]